MVVLPAIVGGGVSENGSVERELGQGMVGCIHGGK